MPELRNLSVDYISLVKKPANGKALTLKSGAVARPVRLAKLDDAQMRAYGIVYSPDEVDSQGDWASADTIRQAADGFMRAGLTRNVDREHDFRPSGQYVAESWLIRSPDPLFPTEGAGAWAVGIQVTDPIEWRALKNGDREGLSLAGEATYQEGQTGPEGPEQKGDHPPGWFARFVAKFQPVEPPVEGAELNEEQVRALIAEEVGKAVTLALQNAKAADEAADANEGAGQQEAGQMGGIGKAAVAALQAQIGQLTGDLALLRADVAKAATRGATEGGADGWAGFSDEGYL